MATVKSLHSSVYTSILALSSSSATMRHGLRHHARLYQKSGWCHLSTGTKKSSNGELIPSRPIVQSSALDHNEAVVSLAPLSTSSLLRSLFLGYCFKSPRILSLSLKTMDKIVHSKMAFLNPDRNFVLGGLLRAFVYNQFCAGTNPAEVKKSIANIKAMGYDGVILGYGREIVLDNENKSKDLGSSDEAATSDPHIAAWLDGNLKTLDCIGAGDYMNVK